MYQISTFGSHIQKMFALPNLSGVFLNCSLFQKFSQDSKNVHALQNCSCCQICSGFFKIVLHCKICSQDSKNVHVLQNCSCFQICSGFFKTVHHFKICSQDSKYFRFYYLFSFFGFLFLFLFLFSFFFKIFKFC